LLCVSQYFFDDDNPGRPTLYSDQAKGWVTEGIPSGAEYFFVLTHKSSVVYPVYSLNTRGSLPGGKMTGHAADRTRKH